jgi:type II secretory pathway pseudopilin PulG
MSSWLIWVIVAIIVIAVIAAVIAAVAAANKRKQENNRNRAGELREQAAAQATGLQQREAHARETEARAAQARAEADRKQAEADRLEAEAADRHGTADSYRQEHEEHLRRADELDPDVDTSRDDYVPPTAGEARGGTHAGERTNETGVGGETLHETPSAQEQPTTVTHPDGSTEAVEPSAYDDQASGDPSDPRLGGGSHRA